MDGFLFKTPPGWPVPPADWTPPEGWSPDPTWPPAPADWAFWVIDDRSAAVDSPPAEPAIDPTGEGRAVSPGTSPPTDQTNTVDGITVPDRLPDPGESHSDGHRVAELEKEVDALHQQLAEANSHGTNQQASTQSDDLVDLDDAHLLQQVGIYEYRHPLENAEQYRDRLTRIREELREFVRTGTAIQASERFAYNNSLALGRRMTADFSKLMLRAYNAEADNCIRALRAGVLPAAVKRLEVTATTIARLGKMMEMQVSPGYHALRTTELELTADYLFKQQEDREAAREERERLREERKAELELTAQREKLDKERNHYLNTVNTLRERGDTAGLVDAEQRLAQIDAAIAENDFRAANIRAGYVYVISNVGSFGSTVVKIGMIRRLEPMDRVRELSDASVPFPFDVHALYFSEDAVTLESELHSAFASRRLNHANPRREFFFATPEAVRDVLAQKVGNLLEYTSKPDAEQYYQSLSSWPKDPQGHPDGSRSDST